MVAFGRRRDYGGDMDTPARPDPADDTLPTETTAERDRRLAWERERIAEAEAEIAAGRVIDFDDVDAWLSTIGTDHELPRPRARRRG